MPRISAPETLRDQLAPDAPQLCPELDWRCVHVSGAEAETFLQGQLTLDLTRLPPDQHRLSAWCTGKGRVWTMLRVWREDEGFGLLVPAALLERFLPRLQMFVLRAQVSLTTDPAAVSGQLRPDCGIRDSSRHADGIRQLVLNDRQILQIGGETPPDPPADAALWTALRLLDGEAQIGPETQERFLPQALGLAPGAGLDFNKGCYVGQEIVARVHYRGRCPEQLALFIDPDEDELAGRVALADVQAGGHRLVQVVEKA